MTILPGEAYWVGSPLPGESSGGEHTSVVLSSRTYNDRTGYPVIAGMRHQSPKAYRIEVTPASFTPAAGQPPLDQPRVVGLDQCRGAATSELSSMHGRIDNASLARVLANVPVQFQLGASSYARRGEYWELDQPVQGFTRVLVVLNDRAVLTDSMSQVLALPMSVSVEPGPLLVVAKTNLKTLAGRLSDKGQAQLDRLIRQMFGL